MSSSTESSPKTHPGKSFQMLFVTNSTVQEGVYGLSFFINDAQKLEEEISGPILLNYGKP